MSDKESLLVTRMAEIQAKQEQNRVEQESNEINGKILVHELEELRDELAEAKKSEMVECHIFIHDLEERLVFNYVNGVNFSLAMAQAMPDFLGFKYKDGTVMTDARRYVGVDNGLTHALIKTVALNSIEVLTPTHCLFRSKP